MTKELVNHETIRQSIIFHECRDVSLKETMSLSPKTGLVNKERLRPVSNSEWLNSVLVAASKIST